MLEPFKLIPNNVRRFSPLLPRFPSDAPPSRWTRKFDGLLALTGILALGILAPYGHATIPTNRSVDVRTFGATPNDQTDDTSAFNNAINYVSSSGGGIVNVPAGVYIINSRAANFPLRTQSRVYLRGQRDATNHIVSVLKMPRTYSNRSLLVIGDPHYADESRDVVVNPSATQTDVEISDIGFDLDNGRGRHALQLRFLTTNVWVHDCTGFQSGLDQGERASTAPGGDNHFFNLACYGDPGARLVSSNIVLERCSVRGNLQLTADGGYGIINLTIRDNDVTAAYSHGIAITCVGRQAFFDNIQITGNRIINIAGDGIYVSDDQNAHRDYHFVEGERNIMQRLTISGNTLSLGSASASTSGGIVLQTFLEMSQIQVSNNQLMGTVVASKSSRNALNIQPWDLNWTSENTNQFVAGADFHEGQSQISLHHHNFVTGMQIEFRAKRAGARLPAGLETFRRYRVKYVDADTFSLTWLVGGSEISFARAVDFSAQFAVVFAPAAESLTIANNTITGVWDYSLVLGGSIDADIFSNDIDNAVCLSGENESTHFQDNDFSAAFSFSSMGTSLLTTRPSSVPTRGPAAFFNANRWTIDETTCGYCYTSTAVVGFNPHDAKRSMDYIFSENTVRFSGRGPKKFQSGVRDSGQLGSIRAKYGQNSIQRNIDSSPANIVLGW